MDESAQQLIHELRHATASTLFDMPIEEYSFPQNRVPLARLIQIAPAKQERGPMDPMDAVKSSLLAGNFSDITITHGSDTWKAHKVVVCSQSAILAELINKLEGTSTLQLEGHNDEAFKLVMEYLYTTTYTTSPSAPDFCLPVHLKVHDLATELQIPSLQELAAKFFAFNLSSYVDNLEVFFSAVKEVYAKTRSANFGLRMAVIEAAVSEMRTLLAHEEAWKSFSSIMAELPEFQKDMICVMAEIAMDQQVPALVLCEACGPRAEGDGYTVQIKCKCCGADRNIRIS